MEPTCPQCHAVVRATDFFCYNCGKNLKPKPLATTPETLLMYYLGSIFLPPMGIIWGIRYFRQESRASKVHGVILITMTIIELTLLAVWTVNVMNTINTQVNQQLNSLQGF